jgi:CubicO group peptidase (beta-lactamase class C family)
MFHIILPHMMLASVSGAPRVEDQLAALSDAAYDHEIMAFAGQFYEDFVAEHILAPVGATATCDTRKFLGVRQVAAVYSDGPTDRTGVLPASSTGNCAAGGWVISANDLSRIVSALRREGILAPLSRARLLNLGPTRIWDVTTQGDTTAHHSHNGDHDGMRAVILMRAEGHAVALIYNTRLGNSFLDQQMLVDAFDANRR